MALLMPRHIACHVVEDKRSADEAEVFVTGSLIKAARALAGLTIDDLAARSGVGARTIKRAEIAGPGDVKLNPSNTAKLIFALAACNVAMIPETDHEGAGARYLEPQTVWAVRNMLQLPGDGADASGQVRRPRRRRRVAAPKLE